MTWEKGQSGNPGGRPKRGTTMTELLHTRLDLKDGDLLTHKARIAQRLIELAEEGNVPAIKEILDRTEGKVPDKVEVEGKVTVVFDQ